MPTTDGAPVAELAYTPEPPAPVAEAPQAADFAQPLEVPSVPVVADYVIPGMTDEVIAEAGPITPEATLQPPVVAEVPAEAVLPTPVEDILPAQEVPQPVTEVATVAGPPQETLVEPLPQPVAEAAPVLSPATQEQLAPAPAAAPVATQDTKPARQIIDVKVESKPRDDRSGEIKKARLEDIKNSKSQTRLGVSLEKVIPEL